MQIIDVSGKSREEGKPDIAVKRLAANLHIVNSEKRVEANKYRHISHGNLQRFLGSTYDENDRVLDLKFEFVPGKSLEQRLTDGGPPFGWKKLIQYSVDAAQGMMELHLSPNLCHGDLKPSNIVIKATGDAVVTDWYISSYVDHDELIDVLKVSDPLFLAPELLDDSSRRFSESTDVYSLGMCLLVVRLKLFSSS